MTVQKMRMLMRQLKVSRECFVSYQTSQAPSLDYPGVDGLGLEGLEDQAFDRKISQGFLSQKTAKPN